MYICIQPQSLLGVFLFFFWLSLVLPLSESESVPSNPVILMLEQDAVGDERADVGIVMLSLLERSPHGELVQEVGVLVQPNDARVSQ